MSRDWQWYQQQIPEHRRSADADSEEYYDVSLYDYADVRGTNWNKVPIIMPLLKAGAESIWGEEETKYISIRMELVRSSSGSVSEYRPY